MLQIVLSGLADVVLVLAIYFLITSSNEETDEQIEKHHKQEHEIEDFKNNMKF